MTAAGSIETTLLAALLATQLPFVAVVVILLLTRGRPALSASLSRPPSGWRIIFKK